MFRHLDEFDATTAQGTDGAYNPFFSPDGKWVGFWAYGHFKKAPVGGGPVVEVCEAGGFPRGELGGTMDRSSSGEAWARDSSWSPPTGALPRR